MTGMANEKWLIYASAALEKLCEYCNCGCYEECDYRCSEFEDISNIPPVDATEIVRGRWVSQEYTEPQGKYYLFHCSECCVPNAQKRNYCPNCGAKMDGGNKDENS